MERRQEEVRVVVADIWTGIRIVKALIVVMGSLIVYLSYRGYRRDKSKSMLFLSLGFAFVTIGAVVAGVLFELVGFSLADVYGIEAAMAALGLVTILYSIYGKR